MIEDTISEIEGKINAAEAVSPARRQELLELLATLKTEVARLSKTHEEQADSIASFTRISTHEAMRAESKTCDKPRLKIIYQEVADEIMAAIAKLEEFE